MGRGVSLWHARSHAALQVFALAIAAFVLASIALLAGPAQAHAAETTAELKATKTLTGATLEADQFEFTIEAVTEGAPMPEKTTAKNDADGNVSFGVATYTAAGTYEYRVTETKGTDSTITYDEEPKTITVTVEEKPAEGSSGFTPTVHVGEGAAMQWLQWYAAEGEPVTYDKGEGLNGAATYKVITDGSYQFHPFCMVEEVSSGTDNGQDQKTRHKSNAGVPAGGTYLDAVLQVQNNKKPGVAPSVDVAHVGLQMLFYAGYPYNQANLKGDMSDKEYYKVTQWALWGFMHSFQPGQATLQRDSSGNPEVYDKLLEYAYGGNGANGLWLPESGVTMYIYWPAGSGSADDYQPMINAYLPAEVAEPTLSATATEAAFTNKKASDDTPATKGKIGTTVEGASASAAAKLTAEDAAKKTSLVDTIDYSGLVGGATYTVTGRLMEDGTNEVARASKECVADASGSGSWEITFNFDAGTLKAGKKYVVFEKAESAEDANSPYEHADASDVAQTVVVNSANDDKKDEGNNDDKKDDGKKDENNDNKKEETTTTVDVQTDEGNKVEIVDENGKLVEGWTSDGKPHPVTLKPGDYVISVTDKDGNMVQKSIRVGEDGKVYVLQNGKWVEDQDLLIALNPEKPSTPAKGSKSSSHSSSSGSASSTPAKGGLARTADTASTAVAAFAALLLAGVGTAVVARRRSEG